MNDLGLDSRAVRQLLTAQDALLEVHEDRVFIDERKGAGGAEPRQATVDVADLT